MHEGKNIKAIRQAIRQGQLQEPFCATAVNQVLGINYAGVFLPKHCDQRPDRNGVTWLFDKVATGLYRLNESQRKRLLTGR